MRIDIFKPCTLGGIRMNNRIVRSATHEGQADAQGRPLPALTQRYVQLARGGVGLIITGYASVQREGRCSYPGMLMIENDAAIEPLRLMVDAVHAAGAPIVLQVGHCGRQTRRKITGMQPVAPSAIRDKHFNEETARELTEGEIQGVIDAFVDGIARARDAGFDGAQLHAAHGYLLSEFLSAYSNRRADAWGGSLENRFRIVAEIFRRARQRVGSDYPLLIKINASDGRPRGMRVEEAVQISRLLEAEGCAAIEVSCGTSEDGFMNIRNERDTRPAIFAFNFKIENAPRFIHPILRLALRRKAAPRPDARLYNVPAAAAVKAAISIPVMAVGGIRKLEEMQTILDQGQADFISLCRPLILEPNLAAKLRDGKQTEARCINCSFCAVALDSKPLRCYYGKINSITEGGKS